MKRLTLYIIGRVERLTWKSEIRADGRQYSYSRWPSATDYLSRAYHRLSCYGWRGLFGRGLRVWRDRWDAERAIYPR